MDAESEDGVDNDCDGWVDADFVCPCFDGGDLDALMTGFDTAAFSWASRPSGVSEVLSLQGFEWYQDTDTIWKRDTVGADVYRVDGQGGQPYCEVWTNTWLGSGIGQWDGDDVSESMAIPEESFGVCGDVLDSWITDNGVSLTSW